MVVFGLFMAALGHIPLEVYALIYRGAFASAFSWQNTLARAAPLVLTALCVALPAQVGPHGDRRRGRARARRARGGGGRPRAGGRRRRSSCSSRWRWRRMVIGGRVDRAGRRAAPVPRRQRDDREPAAHLHRHRDLQPPRRRAAARSGQPQQAVDGADRRGQHARHAARPRRALGARLRRRSRACSCTCSCATPRTASRCASSAATSRAARLAGLPVGALVLAACALGGAAAGLAGMVEVAAVHGSANASLIAGYGYAGILVAFIARQNPLAIVPVAVLVGGIVGERRHAAAPARPARRDRPRAAGRRVHADPRERDALRPACAPAAARGR